MEALEEERKELKQHLADMENKLEDLKTKNNVSVARLASALQSHCCPSADA